MKSKIELIDCSQIFQKKALNKLYMPLIGLVMSVLITLFLIFKRSPWSLRMSAYTMIPIFISIIGSMFLIAFQRGRHKKDARYSKKIYAMIISGLLVTLIIFNVVFWKSNSVKYTDISLTQLVEMEKRNTTDLESYYVIYSTKSCVFCKQMKPLYEKNFFENRGQKVYMVDISQEITSGELIERKEINKIPALVHYKNGAEIDRIEGVATMDSLNSFVN